ncbi:MAG: exo-beta-N-acetylmuramidase NamZ family protein [Anaerolineae bacterium]
MVIPGIEVLTQSDFRLLRGLRVGLLTNPSAVTRDLTSAYTLFTQAETLELHALFGPEHGFSASAQDGVKVGSAVDPRTGVPVHSLYGDTMRPTPEMLADIDVLVCDIQDIGVRYYTFLWTISHVIEACGENGVPVVILDRPNPLGDEVLGGGLAEGISTLVGRYDVPVQYGMTLGEMVRYLNDHHNPTPCEVTVIACANYTRKQDWHESGLPFVAPSPNMPHWITARHYAGSCLIEGTTLSEGRGTALPFEIVGAPMLDGDQLAQALNALNLDGVRFRPHNFTPAFSKYAGEACYGVQAHITDERIYQALPTWLQVLQTIRQLAPDVFDWKAEHFDRLIGDPTVREALDAGESVASIGAGWFDYCTQFRHARHDYLLY